MDLQAAENAYKKEVKSNWACPCNGCAKAVKQERKRILEEISKIDIDTPSQINAFGMKILIEEIIKNEKNKVSI